MLVLEKATDAAAPQSAAYGDLPPDTPSIDRVRQERPHLDHPVYSDVGPRHRRRYSMDKSGAPLLSRSCSRPSLCLVPVVPARVAWTLEGLRHVSNIFVEPGGRERLEQPLFKATLFKLDLSLSERPPLFPIAEATRARARARLSSDLSMPTGSVRSLRRNSIRWADRG